MTLNDRNSSGFYYWFEPSYLKKYLTNYREIYRIAGFKGVDVCCEMRLRSLKGRCYGNRFLFTQSSQVFRHSDQCVTDFAQSSTTRSIVVSVTHEVDRRRFLLTTSVYRETDIDPWKQIFPLDISSTLACDGIRQEVRMLCGRKRTNN